MKSLQSFVVTSCLTVTALSVAHAAPVRPVLPPGRMAADAPFIEFTTVKSNIDCKTMGGPFLAAPYTSDDEATVEIHSNLGIQVNYDNGANLTSGTNTLPTKFQFSMLGNVQVDGGTPKSYADYSGYIADNDRNAQDSGSIAFAPGAPMGLKARVMVQRHGLNDHAGQYSTQVTLNWFTW